MSVKKGSFDFNPVKKSHNNFVYKAPEGDATCFDLSVTNLGWGSVSTWKIKSIIERLRFLFTGEISLVIHGGGMPPVSLHSGDWVKRVALKEKSNELASEKTCEVTRLKADFDFKGIDINKCVKEVINRELLRKTEEEVFTYLIECRDLIEKRMSTMTNYNLESHLKIVSSVLKVEL